MCETVAELEAEIGLARRLLQATVTAYNDGAPRGEDPLLHKKPEWLKPDRVAGRRDRPAGKHGGFTLGGLQTTLDAEVLHVSGEPIPGLFAAGRSHRRAGRVGLCERHLARRRQLLRPPRRPLRRQGLITLRSLRTSPSCASIASVAMRVSTGIEFCDLCDTATARCYK